MHKMKTDIPANKPYLWFECLFLFIGMPTALLYVKPPHFVLFVALWILAIWAGWVLWSHKDYSRRRFWDYYCIHKRSIGDIMAWFIPSAFILLFYTYYFEQDLWFRFPRENPAAWAIVMIMYPILSVYPQEILYRGFFFRRYATIFTDQRAQMIASAIAFGYLHILFENVIAVVLSTIGGFYFAQRYYKYKSLLLASIEHAIYGQLLFTIGLGWYFYSGAKSVLG